METDKDQNSKRLIPIAFAEDGAVVRIVSLRGGQSLRKRFAGRGFLPGESVRIIQNHRFGGPMLLEIRGTRFAIGRGEAQRIMVDDHLGK